MSHRVRLSPAALRDLNQIRAWYSQAGAGPVARRKVRQILAGIASLSTWPEQGRPLAEAPGLRSLTIQQHVIVYQVAGPEEFIDVLRIWAPGQDRR